MNYAELQAAFAKNEDKMSALGRAILCNRSFTDMATNDERNAYVDRAVALANSEMTDDELVELRSRSADALKRLAAKLTATQPPQTARRINMPVWNSWVDVLPEDASKVHQEIDALARNYSACKAVLAFRSAK